VTDLAKKGIRCLAVIRSDKRTRVKPKQGLWELETFRDAYPDQRERDNENPFKVDGKYEKKDQVERAHRGDCVESKTKYHGWKMLGLMTFLDPPRDDTKLTVDYMEEFGVKVKMITGDHLEIARETAKQLGMARSAYQEECAQRGEDWVAGWALKDKEDWKPNILYGKSLPKFAAQVLANLSVPEAMDAGSDMGKIGNSQKVTIGDNTSTVENTCEAFGPIDGLGQKDPATNKYPKILGSSDGLVKGKYLGEVFGERILSTDGFAQVLPEHKFLIVQACRQRRVKYLANGQEDHSSKVHLVGMCGDGVNDAPALKRADVGIAVEGATDAARASSDIVLTEPGLSTIIKAMITSRKIFTRMKNFVIYRVACTEQLLFFFFISCLCYDPNSRCHEGSFNMWTNSTPVCDHWFKTGMQHECAVYGAGTLNPDYNEFCKPYVSVYASGPWPKYFYLPVIALVTITILNDGTIISVAFDNVESSKLPEEWNILVLYFIASMVGGVALGSSLLLLSWALDSVQPDGVMQSWFGMDALDFYQIKTLMYLKISLSDYLSLFNSRCKSWCFSRAPAPIVVGGAVFATTCATLFARFWPFESDMKGVPWPYIGFTWAYVFCWGIIQDICKVAAYTALLYTGVIKELGLIPEEEVKGELEKADTALKDKLAEEKKKQDAADALQAKSA